MILMDPLYQLVGTCCGLYILWAIFFELVLKREGGIIAKIEASREEYEEKQEFLSALGLQTKCEICGQEEHTTEEHYTRWNND
jgi:hypothetical protein